MLGSPSRARWVVALLILALTACSQSIRIETHDIEGTGAAIRLARGDGIAYCEYLEPLIRCALSIDRPDPRRTSPSDFSPMIANANEIRARLMTSTRDGRQNGFVETDTGKFVVYGRDVDASGAPILATIQPEMSEDGVRLNFTSAIIENLYGLGEQFGKPGVINGDWGGRMRAPGCKFGNALVKFHGGYVGNAQFPILYCVGDDDQNFAIFVDNVQPHTWDFTQADQPDADGVRRWTLTVPPYRDTLRWYVLSGSDLPSLRHQYMELVGKPPVPPRKMFGLWLSEYGFNDWNELDDKLRTLQANHFPIDGFVLDLQWFGDIGKEYKGSRMGNLDWDLDKFPNPKQEITELRDKEGVGIMVIEESYIDMHLPEYQTMSSKGYLVKSNNGQSPARIESWWGTGGMIDWTNQAGADYWHDEKRAPLVEDGVMGHWTDLGEPEAYRGDFWYANPANPGRHDHEYVHNLFNFRWAESIARGYERHDFWRPPFILSRSGTSGIQRFGACLWSGDIGSNLDSLAAHLNVQMHMSLSGIDYFGSDIGGFRRDSLRGDDEDEMYTRWFAHAALLDVPMRPHTSNTENRYETAPDRVGDLKSNLFNLRRRYALTPYLYSLAQRAAETGEPIFPPLVYYYQNDDRVRQIADQKMIGRDLMVVTDVKSGQRRRTVYLPAGDWYDFETGKFYPGDEGREITIDPTRPDGVFTLPLFARAGAIIPMMHVDEKTMNVEGMRTDGSRRDEVMLRVFMGDDYGATSFTTVDGALVTSFATLEERDCQCLFVAEFGTKAEVVNRNHSIIINLVIRHAIVEPPTVFVLRTQSLTQSEIESGGFLLHPFGNPTGPLTKIPQTTAITPNEPGWRMAGPNIILISSGEFPAGNHTCIVVCPSSRVNDLDL